MKNRKDYFLIWGSGLEFENQIIEIIERDPNFKIEYFYRFKAKNIKRLISNVYFNDYTPISHLKNKTKYLKNINNKNVLIIFCTNKRPMEMKIKSFNKTHIESISVNKLKNKIRKKFNPKVDGKITHDHVIHGSDNQEQTEHIIRFLNDKNLNIKTIYSEVENTFKYQKCVKIKTISIKRLKARLLIKDSEKISTKIVNLNKTPHFFFIKKKKSLYGEYLKKFRGLGLNYNYSEKRFNKYIKSFNYLNQNNQDNYIKVEKKNNFYVIIDGLHRASIMKNKRVNKIIIEEKIF
jgi:hypothetical protein